MTAIIVQLFSVLLIGSMLACSTTSSATPDIRNLAPAKSLAETETPNGMKTAVFAGGCFWGVEAVFESLKGVKEARSGYAGGDAKTANYDKVSEGSTDHAEAVIVTYDPTKITYNDLLMVFFDVAHDPTQVDRQGPDVGRQYRSAIFFSDEDQKKLAGEYIAKLNASKTLAKPVATELVPLVKFFEAEAYHQNYLVRNPTQPYIVQHDLPKLEDLKKKFPELYIAKK